MLIYLIMLIYPKILTLSIFRFWKYVLTGAGHNSILKLWCCKTWECLQTLSFFPSPTSRAYELFFKISLDMTSRYLLMSEINNRLLYVLNLEKNDEQQVVNVSYISEFLLSSPIISFCIIDAGACKLRCSNSTEELYKDDHDYYDDEFYENVVALNLYVVQAKHLQECTIMFHPESSQVQNGVTVKKVTDSAEKKVIVESSDNRVSVGFFIFYLYVVKIVYDEIQWFDHCFYLFIYTLDYYGKSTKKPIAIYKK